MSFTNNAFALAH